MQLRDRASPEYIPIPRERPHAFTPTPPRAEKRREAPPVITIGEDDEIESGTVHMRSGSHSPSPSVSSATSPPSLRSKKKGSRNRVTVKKEKVEQQDEDKLSYLVQSATQMSEFEEKEGGPSSEDDAPSRSPRNRHQQRSITPSSEEGAQVLLSRLAELCQERAQAEAGHTDSNDESDRGEKKRKRSHKQRKVDSDGSLKRKKSDASDYDTGDHSPASELEVTIFSLSPPPPIPLLLSN